jgi:chemotaxis signal transduction protein
MSGEVKGQREGGGAARLLIIDSESGPVALAVDEVCGVLRYHPRELESVPATLANSQKCHTRGVLKLEQRIVGVLDVDLLSRTIARALT